MTHWYDGTTGQPRYEIAYADGRPGKTPDLRDARKLQLVPSVTSVLGILDKPGLNNWKVEQAILAALTCPLIQPDAATRPEMTTEEMLSRIKRDAEEQSKAAMQRGTDIHDAIEKCLDGVESTAPEQYWQHANGVQLLLNEKEIYDWLVESHLPGGLGYGGRCDLYNDEFLIDFKTKEFNAQDVATGKVKGWPEQEVQLVAYDLGFGGPRRRLVNVFVSASVPGLVHWFEWPGKGYDAAVAKWRATLECWYAWKGYRPERVWNKDLADAQDEIRRLRDEVQNAGLGG